MESLLSVIIATVIIFIDFFKLIFCEHNPVKRWNSFVASCPPLSKISKGVVKGTKRTHGSMIQFKCNYRYQLIGASSATCEDGKWSKTLPRCAGTYVRIY